MSTALSLILGLYTKHESAIIIQRRDGTITRPTSRPPSTGAGRGEVGECYKCPGPSHRQWSKSSLKLRFWPMPPRRPLVGGKGSAGRFAGVLAPAAGSYALGDRSPLKAIRLIGKVPIIMIDDRTLNLVRA